MTLYCLHLQDSEYFKLGVLAAIALVHGGGAFNLFCPTVYNFLCGVKASELITSIDEVPDSEVREVLKKVITLIRPTHSMSGFQRN